MGLRCRADPKTTDCSADFTETLGGENKGTLQKLLVVDSIRKLPRQHHYGEDFPDAAFKHA